MTRRALLLALRSWWRAEKWCPSMRPVIRRLYRDPRYWWEHLLTWYQMRLTTVARSVLYRIMRRVGYTKVVQVTPHVQKHAADGETLWSTYRWVWVRRCRWM